MTSPDITLLVPTHDLRQALTAVARFTQPKVESLANVTIRATPHLTYVAATNGSAAALAVSSTITLALDTGDDSTYAEFEFSTEDVAKILKVFKGSVGDDDNPGEELRIEVDPEHVTLTDASGMFEGQQLVLPTQPLVEHRARVINTLAGFVRGRSEPVLPDGEVLLFGPNLALFLGASKVYDTDLVFEHHLVGVERDRVSVFVRIGADFIGVLTTRWQDEEELATQRRRRETWEQRMPTHIELVTS